MTAIGKKTDDKPEGSRKRESGDISVDRVAVALGGKSVLDGVDLTVKRGESVVVVGPSGCGKSVLLKIILGLLKPDSGFLRRPAGLRIGMVFQYGALFDGLSIWENVAFYPRAKLDMKAKEARSLSARLLGQVGLTSDVLDKRPAELSGGMKKRAALARALATKPDVLICDEPTSGLDPVTSSHIDELIAREAAVDGRTAITVTHDMSTAKRVGGRAILLYGGKIIWRGTVSEIDSSKNPYLRQFADGKLTGPMKAGTLTG